VYFLSYTLNLGEEVVNRRSGINSDMSKLKKLFVCFNIQIVKLKYKDNINWVYLLRYC
jgi:hypothetical protein